MNSFFSTLCFCAAFFAAGSSLATLTNEGDTSCRKANSFVAVESHHPAVNAATGGCIDVGGIAKDCAIDCALSMLPIPDPCGKFGKLFSAAVGIGAGLANSFEQDTLVHTRIQTDTGYQTKLKPIKDIQVGDEVLAWDELQAHDNSQLANSGTSGQAAQTLHAAYQQANLSNKSASSPINTGASSYENKSNLSTLSSVKPAQRYEKVTDTISSFKEQTLLHIRLDNGQTLQATAGHPFKTHEGWRDAVLLKKGGQLLLGGEADAAERYTTILEIREEVKTTAVFNLEVANLHTFFVGVDGVVVHNGWTPPTTEKHHTIPKEILRDLPPSVAKHPTVRGCKGSPNLKPIPYAKHREIHQGPGGGAYNEKFKDAIEAAGGNREMTPATVTNIRDNLVKLFGL